MAEGMSCDTCARFAATKDGTPTWLTVSGDFAEHPATFSQAVCLISWAAHRAMAVTQ